MTSRAYRTSLLAFITSLAVLFALTAAFNIYFDPLLCFRTVRPANRIVPVVDTRLQKTNRLLEADGGYDALLIGSSRVEQFRQQDFAPLRVFNYAFPSFYPDEAEQYLDLFLRTNNKRPVVVFLGLDFYGSNARSHEHAKPPNHYIETCSSPFYAFKASLNRDTLKYSYRMISGKQEMFSYNRQTLDKITQVLPPHKSDELLKKHLDLYKHSFYGDYSYNENYANIIRRLKDNHQDIRFVVFTTPVTTDLFAVLVRSGRLPDYERWLKDIVDTFGNVYSFMVIDRLTTERRNFLDAHHLYPERTAPLARIISERLVTGDEDIGRLVTKQNLSAHIALIREQAHRLTQEK